MKNNIALAIILAASFASAADWPRWRGPNLDGISAEKIAPEAALAVDWKAGIGIGFSSFSVADGRVFTMGHRDDKDTVWCLDAATGKVVWQHSYAADLGDKYYEGGTSGTPTVDGGRVFALSRWGDVFCLDAATGKVVWGKNVQQETEMRIPDWGYAGSPLVQGDMLLLNIGESGLALDKSSGSILWKSNDKDSGYSTAQPFTRDGKKLAILGSGRSYNCIEAETGKLLWSHDWRTSYGVNAADAILHNDQVFISSGYEKGAALLQLGSGQPTVVWQSKVMRNQMSPSIRIGDYLYGIDGNESKSASLKCIEWQTGRERWAWPQSGCGTVAAAGEGSALIVLGEKGELSIGAASPDGFKPAASAKVLSGRCWTVPVLANGRIYCRNAAGDMVCVTVAAK